MPAAIEKVVAEFIANEIRRRFPTSKSKKKLPHEFSLQQIADELGVSKPQISSVLEDASGIGPSFEQKFADKFFSGSRDAQRVAAIIWAQQTQAAVPPPPGINTIPTTSAPLQVVAWPRRDDAARFAIADGIPQEIIDVVNARCTDAKYRSWPGVRWTDEYRAELAKGEQGIESELHPLRQAAPVDAPTKPASSAKAAPKSERSYQAAIREQQEVKAKRRQKKAAKTAAKPADAKPAPKSRRPRRTRTGTEG